MSLDTSILDCPVCLIDTSHITANSTRVVVVLGNPDVAFFAPAGAPGVLHRPILLLVLCDAIADNKRSTVVQEARMAFWQKKLVLRIKLCQIDQNILI